MTSTFPFFCCFLEKKERLDSGHGRMQKLCKSNSQAFLDTIAGSEAAAWELALCGPDKLTVSGLKCVYVYTRRRIQFNIMKH